MFAVRLDQQTEKQRGQGGIWIIIFTFECMFDISLFIQGEYMALKLDFVWSRQAIWGLSRAVVRSNLVIWNFSSPSFTEVHVKSPVLYEEKRLSIDCWSRDFYEKQLRKKQEVEMASQDLSINTTVCVTFICCQTIIIMLCWLENHKLLAVLLPIFFFFSFSKT